MPSAPDDAPGLPVEQPAPDPGNTPIEDLTGDLDPDDDAAARLDALYRDPDDDPRP